MRCRSLTLGFAVRTILRLVTVRLLKLRHSAARTRAPWRGQVIRLLLRHGDVLLNIILLQAHRAHMRRGGSHLASFLLPLRLKLARLLLLLLKLLLTVQVLLLKLLLLLRPILQGLLRHLLMRTRTARMLSLVLSSRRKGVEKRTLQRRRHCRVP